LEKYVRFVSKNALPFSLALVAASCAASGVPQSDPSQEAVSLEKQGKLVEAEAAWSALSKQYPTNAEPFAHMGLLEAHQQHYTQAVAYYRKAMALNPSMPGLRLNLGLAYFKAGDYEHAIQELDPLLKTNPGDQRLTILIGMSHYGLGQYAAASPYLKQASDQDSQNLPLLLTLAHTCLYSNQYQCVLDAYHRIIALSAESAEADMLVGETLDAMKDSQGAVREFRAAVAANPKEPNVHFGLGYLLWTQGQHAEAAREFQAELDNDPHHFLAALYLADSYIQTNRMDDARPLLENLIKVDPKNAMEHVDLGIVYADENRKEDAAKEFQEAIKLAPNNVNAHYRLGRLYRSMGQTAEAKAELEKADSLNKAEDERLLKIMSKIPANNQAPPAGESNSPQK
jgi:tetratricopeptide (TPR) repeat protein